MHARRPFSCVLQTTPNRSLVAVPIAAVHYFHSPQSTSVPSEDSIVSCRRTVDHAAPALRICNAATVMQPVSQLHFATEALRLHIAVCSLVGVCAQSGAAAVDDHQNVLGRVAARPAAAYNSSSLFSSAHSSLPPPSSSFRFPPIARLTFETGIRSNDSAVTARAHHVVQSLRPPQPGARAVGTSALSLCSGAQELTAAHPVRAITRAVPCDSTTLPSIHTRGGASPRDTRLQRHPTANPLLRLQRARVRERERCPPSVEYRQPWRPELRAASANSHRAQAEFTDTRTVSGRVAFA